MSTTDPEVLQRLVQRAEKERNERLTQGEGSAVELLPKFFKIFQSTAHVSSKRARGARGATPS